MGASFGGISSCIERPQRAPAANVLLFKDFGRRTTSTYSKYIEFTLTNFPNHFQQPEGICRCSPFPVRSAMRLDLDSLDIVFTFVDDLQTLLSCSLTCHAFREIAAKKVLAVRAVDLRDERSIRAFHTFLFADTSARAPYVRIINLSIEDVDDVSYLAVAQLVVDIFKHAPYLERLYIPFGEETFACLGNPEVHKTIGKLTRLQELSIPLWCGYTEQILLTIRSPLKILRVSLKQIWTSERTTWITPTRLHEVIGAFSQTLESLGVTERAIKFDPDSKGPQYLAVKSVEFFGTRGPPWMDVLVHMFPNLRLTLDLGDGDHLLVDDDAEQQRVRLVNKADQARGVRWERMGTVIGDTLTLFMLGLTCPIDTLMVNSSCAHLKDRLVAVLRDSLPTHLKLTLMLSHGVGAFEETFPVEVVPRLTHLVLFVMYDNLDEDDRIDPFTLSAIQWAAFLVRLMLSCPAVTSLLTLHTGLSDRCHPTSQSHPSTARRLL